MLPRSSLHCTMLYSEKQKEAGRLSTVLLLYSIYINRNLKCQCMELRPLNKCPNIIKQTVGILKWSPEHLILFLSLSSWINNKQIFLEASQKGKEIISLVKYKSHSMLTFMVFSSWKSLKIEWKCITQINKCEIHYFPSLLFFFYFSDCNILQNGLIFHQPYIAENGNLILESCTQKKL